MNGKRYFSSEINRCKITGGIFERYQKILKEKAIPYQWDALNDKVQGAEKSGVIENFRIAAGESKKEYYGTCFQDSDLGKWLEAASYALAWGQDEKLNTTVEGAIDLIERAQQKDGYVNTYFTVVQPEERFSNIRECDELYCFGHLAEAAAAHYQATGKTKFLDIMCRFADLMCDTFGDGEGQIPACDGHAEAELAFVRLYEVTGEKRYLDQAGFQLHTRGSEPYYYDIEWEKRGCKSFHPHLQGERPSEDKEYDQSNGPVTGMDHPVGHAVKLGYLLAGMAAYSQHARDAAMYQACKRVFREILTKQIYVTGAVGATRHKEAFTKDYHLPNDRAYGETCASAAMAIAIRRMLLVEPDAVLADALERILYNALPAGMSLSGDRYFYVNPLEVYPKDLQADHDYDSVKAIRQKWFACACCPPNLIRVLADLGEYLYVCSGSELYIQLFAESETEIPVSDSRRVRIRQTTQYPFEGRIQIELDRAAGLDVLIRIPGWCTKGTLHANGEKRLVGSKGRAVYEKIHIDSEQAKILLELDLSPYCVRANPEVKADAWKIAAMRGPVVYCAEEFDNGPGLFNLALDPEAGFQVCEDKVLGVPCLIAQKGCRVKAGQCRSNLYTPYRDDTERAAIKLIPYSMWGNREKDRPGEMAVWLNIQK